MRGPAGSGRLTLLCGCLGNRKGEGRAPRRRALDPDATAVSLDDALGDGKAEPGPLTVRAGRLPESVKDARQVLGRDARARIRDVEDDLAIPRGRTYRDTAASVRELDRVADQVLEHLEQPVPITPDVGKITVAVDAKLERRRRGEWFLHIHGRSDELTCR